MCSELSASVYLTELVIFYAFFVNDSSRLIPLILFNFFKVAAVIRNSIPSLLVKKAKANLLHNYQKMKY